MRIKSTFFNTMLRLKKNKNVLLSLRDRELGVGIHPCKLSLNIMNQLLRSKSSRYNCIWSKQSSRPITCDGGQLYFDHCKTCYTFYGPACKPVLNYHLKPKSAKKKVVDIITCIPTCKILERCTCHSTPCRCISGFILCLTDDNWLCHYSLKSGKLLTEVFVKRTDQDFKFKYCDWDVYAERIVLSSMVNPLGLKNEVKSDVLVNLAVFTVIPLEFLVLLEIKKSVFGMSCKHVNVSDQLLILGMGYDQVHIYSFLDLLNSGGFQPYKLGQQYNKFGKIGENPTGLPLNFNVNVPPPLLFKVQCFGQSVEFGGYPFHCIYPKPKHHLKFVIEKLNSDSPKQISHIESNVWNDEPETVWFHPDNSNRILSRDTHEIHVYQLSYNCGTLNLDKTYSMGFKAVTKNIPGTSSFGRRIIRNPNLANLLFGNDRCLMATDYEDELDLFAILGVQAEDPDNRGIVKLYDSFTGVEVKCVKLNQTLCETNYYQLYVDLDLIVIIEKNAKNMFSTFVYRIFPGSV